MDNVKSTQEFTRVKLYFYVRFQFLRTLTCADKNATVEIHLNTKVSSNIWTHVAVTWDYATGISAIYVDGKNVGYRNYPPREVFFYLPTGKPYKLAMTTTGTITSSKDQLWIFVFFDDKTNLQP